MAQEFAGAFLGLFGLAWIFFIFLWFLIAVISIAGLIFWIIMIVDVVKREFPKSDDKTMWVLIVVLTGVIGSIIYYFMIKKKEDAKVNTVKKK